LCWCDIAGVQRRRRDLVEQRLKQVVIAAIDQRDRDRRIGELARRREASEAAPDDDDVRSTCGRGHGS
jgi:hypothetical protein